MIFHCGGGELDTERFSVTKDNEAISIEPKVFDLLVYLMTHREQLVTRDELLEALWPGRIIHDNVLSNDIKLARAALGDDGEQQKFIKTIRGRGYQFVGEVEQVETNENTTAGSAPDVHAPEPGEQVVPTGTRQSRPQWVLIFTALLLAVMILPSSDFSSPRKRTMTLQTPQYQPRLQKHQQPFP